MVAHRFTPTAVARYIPIFEQILAMGDFPAKLTINPLSYGIATETCTARLRDAATALSLGHVRPPSFDTDRFTRLWNQYYVTNDGSSVYVVPKTEKKTTARAAVTATEAPSTGPFSLVLHANDATPDVLRAFALLLGLRLLQTQVAIPSACLPDDLITDLTSTHDIVIKRDANNDRYLMF